MPGTSPLSVTGFTIPADAAYLGNLPSGKGFSLGFANEM